MKFHAKNNDLIIKESERLISGSVNIYTCEFTFDESWDGYTVTAVFSTNGSRLVNMAVVDGKCQIPNEVLRPNARIRVGIFGTDGVRSRPTTYSDWITVEQGADMTGNTAQPPTPSVYEQWLKGLSEKNDEWETNEQARVEAENERVEAENERAEAEEAREDLERGYVAQAQAAAEEAETWAKQAKEVVGGDYATKDDARAMADTAESNANAYTDSHNTDENAHADIRKEVADAIAAIPAPDAYTKTETLTDATKTVFGLGADAVPDDVFSFIGKYAQHCWRKTTKTFSEQKTDISSHVTVTDPGQNVLTFSYSQSIQIDSDGNLSLLNPQSMAIATNIDGARSIANLAPCYISSSLTPGIYYVPSGAEAGDHRTNGDYYTVCFNNGTFVRLSGDASVMKKAQSVTVTVHKEFELVFSTDRNAYPDGGEVDGVEYQYLGVPFENAVIAVKIATGSYTGTETYGKDNPNSLTFDFAPQLVRIELVEGDNNGFTAIRGMTRVASTEYNTQSSHRPYLTWNGNTLEWYSEQDPYKQLNGTYKYKYFAIG